MQQIISIRSDDETMMFLSDRSNFSTMASNKTEQQRNRKKENFLRQFRDEKSKEIKQLTAAQFMEIWSHYDTDGKKTTITSGWHPRSHPFRQWLHRRTRAGRLTPRISVISERRRCWSGSERYDQLNRRLMKESCLSVNSG